MTIGERPNKKNIESLDLTQKTKYFYFENLFLDGERKLKVVKDELTKQVDKCKEDLNTRLHFFKSAKMILMYRKCEIVFGTYKLLFQLFDSKICCSYSPNASFYVYFFT